ncbi:MAG: MFS transporter, partial [Halobacteria archaeon]|nr:MFS transporter [Halobacteria archaeon]
MLVAVFINDPEREDKGEEAGQDDLSFSLTDEKGLGLDPVFVLGLGTLFMAVTVSLFATLQEGINARLAQSSFAFGIEFAVVVLANVVLQVPVGSRS